MPKQDEIEKIRAQIDKIDEKLKKYLEKRAKKIEEIARIKKSLNLKSEDKERDTKILNKIDGKFEKAVFANILKESKKYQAEL